MSKQIAVLRGNIFQVRMTFAEWANVKDNPIQRDTERHARLAKKKHLSSASVSHSIVSAAQLPTGELVKLDGHTRSFLWASGELEIPSDFLTVNVFPVSDLDATMVLYKTFDNASASEDSTDRLQGAFRLVGFKPKSEALAKGGLTGALKLINEFNSGGVDLDIYQAIPAWIENIEKLDTVSSSFQIWTVPVIAAGLITHKIYGDDVLEFWRGYSKDLGTKTGSVRCPIQALTDLMAAKRISRQNLGRANHIDILSKAVSCVEKWRAGESYTVGIKSTDLKQYLMKKKFFAEVPA